MNIIMNKINFIKWKWLITKSIDDYVVTAYFEISIPLYEVIHKHIWEVLTLEVSLWDTKYNFNCYIDTSVKTYLTHCWDHAMLRLDIHLWNLASLMMVWVIITWELNLLFNINKNES